MPFNSNLIIKSIETYIEQLYPLCEVCKCVIEYPTKELVCKSCKRDQKLNELLK